MNNQSKGDPPKRKTSDGRIKVFKKLVSRGTVVDVDQDFSIDLLPSTEDQTATIIKVYKTPEYDGRYVDEPEMEKLGELILDFPNPSLGFDRKLVFNLTFGQMEIRAYCRDQYDKSVAILGVHIPQGNREGPIEVSQTQYATLSRFCCTF